MILIDRVGFGWRYARNIVTPTRLASRGRPPRKRGGIELADLPEFLLMPNTALKQLVGWVSARLSRAVTHRHAADYAIARRRRA